MNRLFADTPNFVEGRMGDDLFLKEQRL